GVAMVAAAAGLASMAHLTATSTWLVLLPGFLLAGIGLGVTSTGLASAALSAVEPAHAGMAAGLVNTLRQVGIATGVAVLGALYTSRVTTPPLPAPAALRPPPRAGPRRAPRPRAPRDPRRPPPPPPPRRHPPPAPPPPAGSPTPRSPRPRSPRSAQSPASPSDPTEPGSRAGPPRPVTANRPPSRPPPRTRPSDRPGPKQRHHSRIRTRRRLVSSPQVNIPEGRRTASGARRRSAFPRPVPRPGGPTWCDDREHGVRCRIGRRCRWRRWSWCGRYCFPSQAVRAAGGSPRDRGIGP